MGLNPQNRGIIEQIIDHELTNVPEAIKVLRLPEVKSQLQIEKENDFVLGLSMGHIMGKFETTFLAMNMRPLTPEESNESTKIIYKRIREIKDAIFKSG